MLPELCEPPVIGHSCICGRLVSFHLVMLCILEAVAALAVNACVRPCHLHIDIPFRMEASDRKRGKWRRGKRGLDEEGRCVPRVSAWKWSGYEGERDSPCPPMAMAHCFVRNVPRWRQHMEETGHKLSSLAPNPLLLERRHPFAPAATTPPSQHVAHVPRWRPCCRRCPSIKTFPKNDKQVVDAYGQQKGCANSPPPLTMVIPPIAVVVAAGPRRYYGRKGTALAASSSPRPCVVNSGRRRRVQPLRRHGDDILPNEGTTTPPLCNGNDAAPPFRPKPPDTMKKLPNRSGDDSPRCQEQPVDARSKEANREPKVFHL